MSQPISERSPLLLGKSRRHNNLANRLSLASVEEKKMEGENGMKIGFVPVFGEPEVEKRQAEETSHSRVVVTRTRVIGTTVITGSPPTSSAPGGNQQPQQPPTSSSSPPPSTSQQPSSSPTQAAPAQPTVSTSSTPSSSQAPITSSSPSSSSIAPTTSSSVVRAATTASVLTITSLPGSGGSNSVSSSTSVENGTLAGNTSETDAKPSGLRTGAIIGIVAAVLLGLGGLLLLVGLIMRRRRDNKRPYDNYFQRKEYRDSSVPITDKSFGGKPMTRPYDGEDDFGNTRSTHGFGYPPGSNSSGYGEKSYHSGSSGRNQRETVFSVNGSNNLAGVGRGNFVIAEDYEDEPVQSRNMSEVQGNRASLGASNKTRDLTAVGPYARYSDASPPQEYSHILPKSAQGLDAYGRPYTDNDFYSYGDSNNGHGAYAYSEDGRHTPTDYYGQALSPAGVSMAEEYADFPSAMASASLATAGKVPTSDEWHGSATNGLLGAGTAGATGLAVGAAMAKRRSASPIENHGRRDEAASPELGHVQSIPHSSSLPQLPPLSPTFTSPLYGGFLDSQPASATASAFGSDGANLNRRSSSAAPTGVMYGSKKTHEELKRAYADLAKAAQVEQPPTPQTGGYSDDTHSGGHSSNDHALMPPPMIPERYVHGRPLSPLIEVDTPDVTPADSKRFSATLGSKASNASLASRPDLQVRQSSDTYPHAKLAAWAMITPQSSAPSLRFPLPSPDVPESPASGPDTPRAVGPSTPEYRFKVHPPTASVVSLDAPFPETPDRQPVARNKALAAPQAVANRASVGSLSDAYDGI